MKLRIISGKLGGRLLNVPKSEKTRPTTERVRETLFNILANEFNFNNFRVLDIYAGSGSLGFEALSRGASVVHFVENDFKVCQNLLDNIKLLRVEQYCKVFKMNALKFSTVPPDELYNLIFADPPFFKDDIYQVVDNLIFNRYFLYNGFIIVERSIQTKNKDTEKFKVEPFKIIGDACLYRISY
ncbi:MAG: 16S rRNA (guanine(966)-N(2))-methyltransferase RsmD [Ignavibacteriaceae bacterium]